MNKLAADIMRLVIEALRAEYSKPDLVLALLREIAGSLFDDYPALAGAINSSAELTRGQEWRR